MLQIVKVLKIYSFFANFETYANLKSNIRSSATPACFLYF